MNYDLKSEEFKQLSMKEKVAIWRDMGSRNELDASDMKEAIAHLRQDRLAIPEKVKKEKVSKAKEETIKGNELVASLKQELLGL